MFLKLKITAALQSPCIVSNDDDDNDDDDEVDLLAALFDRYTKFITFWP